MKKRPPLSGNKEDLRHLAEKRLAHENLPKTAMQRSMDQQRLIHELQVHQIELEMQHEEMLCIQRELEAERGRYADLYVFAPIGYVTLNSEDVILEANLTAANYLGVSRNQLIGQTLTGFLQQEDRNIYHRFRHALLDKGEKQICELRMKRPDEHPCCARLEATVVLSGPSGTPECRVVISDVTDRRQAEEEKEKTISELQKAMSAIKVLSGLVPICASCKKIRDDKGYWNQIEAYIQSHSEIEFTHGICPDCAKKLYPEVDKEPPVHQTGKLVILLVDDEESFRMLFIRQVKRRFHAHEIEFMEAKDGEEALTLLKAGIKPSMIISDYGLPKFNGLELMRRIDRDHPGLYHVPRLMISGYKETEIISEAPLLRYTFFEKTIDNTIFFQKICREMAVGLGLSREEKA